MNTKEALSALDQLMYLNKKKLETAEYFIELLGDDTNAYYWDGAKATAEANITALQSLGISAR